jgi:hypothetical protein
MNEAVGAIVFASGVIIGGENAGVSEPAHVDGSEGTAC